MDLDGAGRRSLSVAGLVAALVVSPLSTGATNASAGRLCGPPTDTVPPQVSQVTLSKDAVDVTSAPATIVVTVTATDTSGNGAPSGITDGMVEFTTHRGFLHAGLHHLVSGDATNGQWRGTVNVPQTARAGEYKLRYASLIDVAGNEQSYNTGRSHPRSPYDISLQPGWDSSFTVTNRGAPPPPPPSEKPGRLTGFTFSPKAVDTTDGPKYVHISATFAAPRPNLVEVEFEGNGHHGRFGRGLHLNRTSSEVWTGRLKVGQWAGSSKASVRVFARYSRRTVSPPYRSIQSSQLQAHHFPSVLKITSGVDNTKPTLTSLSFDPPSVDTTGGAQRVTISASAADRQSGVGNILVQLSHRGGFIKGPGSGPGPIPAPFQYIRLKLQGSHWVGHTNFEECVPSGAYHVSAYVNDKAGNHTHYGTKKLAASRLPTSLDVTSTAGDISPPEASNATASGLDHSITLNFSEGVKKVSDATLSVYAMSPASSRFSSPLPISDIVCSNGTSVVDCSGDNDLVTSAQLEVPDVTGGATYEVWANPDAVTPQLTDAAGNPLGWDYPAAHVTGS